MTETPCAPATARVADPPTPRPPKPASVKRATVCLLVSAAVALVSAILHANVMTPDKIITVSLGAGILAAVAAKANVVTLTVTAGFLALVAAEFAAGRGWARWLFVPVWIVGSLSGMAVVLLAPQAFLLEWPGTVQAIAVLQFMLQTSALVLMFTPASREWFDAPEATTTPDTR